MENNATPLWIEACYRKGYITQETRDQTLQRLTPHRAWQLWITRLLVATGGSLLLSAILYFYAFNWAQLTPMVKLGSVEIAIILCTVAALYTGLRRPAGQYLLLAASFLVGVFLAVFGQIYQTGADAYQLFAVWATLTLGWALLACFAPLWGLWLVVANLALILWMGQEWALRAEDAALCYPVVAAFNGCFLALRRWLLMRGQAWASARWLFRILLTAVVFCLACPVYEAVFFTSHPKSSLLSAVALGILGHVLLFWFYRYRQPDIVALGITGLSTTLIALAWAFHLLPENSAVMFFGSFITLGIFALLVRYLRYTAKKIGVDHV